MKRSKFLVGLEKKARNQLVALLPDSGLANKLYLFTRYAYLVKRPLSGSSDPFMRKLLDDNLSGVYVDYCFLADKFLLKEYAEKCGVPVVSNVCVIEGDSRSDFCRYVESTKRLRGHVIKGSLSNSENYVIEDGVFSFIDFKKIYSSCKINMYGYSRESVYRNGLPVVFVEDYLSSKKGLCDIKVHVFKGEPQIIQVDRDRFVDHKQDFYWFDANKGTRSLDMGVGFPKTGMDINISTEVRKELSRYLELLAFEFDYVRVDFLLNSDDDDLRLGEVTFFPWGFGRRLAPYSWNKLFFDLSVGKGVRVGAS